MNSLLGRQVDNNYVVRMYSIRGLGNMADIEGNQVHKKKLFYYIVYCVHFSMHGYVLCLCVL